MDTQAIGSQFIGTPWSNDQEIYNYASERHDVMGWDWYRVKAELIANGLNEAYAVAIIDNLKAIENNEISNNNLRTYIIGIGIIALVALITTIILIIFEISIDLIISIVMGVISIGLAYLKYK